MSFYLRLGHSTDSASELLLKLQTSLTAAHGTMGLAAVVDSDILTWSPNEAILKIISSDTSLFLSGLATSEIHLLASSAYLSVLIN